MNIFQSRYCIFSHHLTKNCIFIHSQTFCTTKDGHAVSHPLMQWSFTCNYPYICMDSYANRNFIYKENPYPRKAFIDYDRKLFVNTINDIFHNTSNDISFVDGYAPFCKHLFVDNFVGPELKCQTLEITEDNEKYLISAYVRRRKEELPVLMRYFNSGSDISAKPAKYLNIILYDRIQCRKENKAMNIECDDESPYAIISIKPQNIRSIIPMNPSTMMRNALSLDEGGSGVSLDRKEYEKAVQYWTKHAQII